MKEEQGFTLIELMIAVAIMVLVLVGYVGANMAIQTSSAASFERSVAMQDANRVIERVRNASSAGNFPANVTGTFPNNGVVAGFNNLTNEQVVVAYANAAADPLTVTVTVSWLQNGRRNVNATLRTIVTQRV